MKTHLAVSETRDGGSTHWTGTLCGRESSLSSDGCNSEEKWEDVTCCSCLAIMSQPGHWRHRRFLTKKSPSGGAKDIRHLIKVHTGNLINEVLANPGAEIMRIPLQILKDLLVKVGERAAYINDPELNALMARLTIYSIADPESPDYDPVVVQCILEGRVGSAPSDEFRRGVRAAAEIASAYTHTSSHPKDLGDCILAKLNFISKRKIRPNPTPSSHGPRQD